MKAKTYDPQTAKFAATILTCMPDISSDIMQKWIQEPKALQRVLKDALYLCDDKPVFKTWRTIKIGTGLKTAEDFINALKKHECEIDGSADILIVHPDFLISSVETKIELVVVSVAELGFKNGATGEDIFRQAKKLGLYLCPSEVGPQLRLQYKDQPEGGWLLIGMKPIMGTDEEWHVFAISSDFHGFQDLFTKRFPDCFFQADARWVFHHPNQL